MVVIVVVVVDSGLLVYQRQEQAAANFSSHARYIVVVAPCVWHQPHRIHVCGNPQIYRHWYSRSLTGFVYLFICRMVLVVAIGAVVARGHGECPTGAGNGGTTTRPPHTSCICTRRRSTTLPMQQRTDNAKQCKIFLKKKKRNLTVNEIQLSAYTGARWCRQQA